MVTRLRAIVSRRRWPFVWTVVLTVLAVNAAIQSGPVALVIVLLAGVGCAATVITIALLAGYSAAHHAKTEQRAIARIEANRKKELTR